MINLVIMSLNHNCVICNITVTVGIFGSYFCINCNKNIGGYCHKGCTKKPENIYIMRQTNDCVNCTSDKTRMRVKIYSKIKHIMEHYVVSEEKCNELYSEIPSGIFYSAKILIDVCKSIMNNTYDDKYDNSYRSPILYDFLIKKFNLLDENIVEAIKDQWYLQRRNGYFTKRAL